MNQQPLISKFKSIYFFGEYTEENNNQLLGNKGAGLAEMAHLGLPIPPGFTVTTAACANLSTDLQFKNLLQEVHVAMALLGQKIGRVFGGLENPLLVSVRSGAAISMPGMMDTILNIGINDEIAQAWATKQGDASFINDCYCRLIEMFAAVVMQAGEAFKQALPAGAHGNVTSYKDAFLQATGSEFPQNVNYQLEYAIKAVLYSWHNERAIAYRTLHKIDHNTHGTAINIQTMVFGNLNEHSGTGVLFSRNPNNGNDEVYGEFLLQAQGEDIVAGTATPQPLKMLKHFFPDTFKQLQKLAKMLEKYYAEMQDIEFTFEDGKLWLLQARAGKRTAAAAVKLAHDFLLDGSISKEEALRRINPAMIEQLLHPIISPSCKYTAFAQGLPASPGAASGHISFNRNQTIEWASQGKNVILVRTETTADDVVGMAAAAGVVTATGGMTSHAAVVARGMGKPCITAANININLNKMELSAGSTTIAAGEIITINGNTGEIIAGALPLEKSSAPNTLQYLLQEANSIAKISVRANCENPYDAELAKNFGAQGIGLCRTEHMFFSPERIDIMREMILASNPSQRNNALSKLLVYQTEDFQKLFTSMQGLPVTIRLLDPPLHEFLCTEKSEIIRLAQALNKSPNDLEVIINECVEKNPMLGHRGCRLAISNPEIYAMQIRALFNAWLLADSKGQEAVELEIMVPFIMDVSELQIIKKQVAAIAEEISSKAMNSKAMKHISYKIGTMIELPRAALLAGDIAKEADFLSFGTNDLTQTTMGISRDDAKKFLPTYLKNGILEQDPFISLDQRGVGQLIKIAIDHARKQKPQIKIGICGEHGGDPNSIKFCNSLGVDYVSCSPYRVQMARLAAAHATMEV